MLIKSDGTTVDSHAGKLVVEPTKISDVGVHVVLSAPKVAVFVKPGTEPTTAGARFDELGILLLMLGFDTNRYALGSHLHPVLLHDFAMLQLLTEAVLAIGLGLVLIGPLPVWPLSSQSRLEENVALLEGAIMGDLDGSGVFDEFLAKRFLM